MYWICWYFFSISLKIFKLFQIAEDFFSQKLFCYLWRKVLEGLTCCDWVAISFPLQPFHHRPLHSCVRVLTTWLSLRLLVDSYVSINLEKSSLKKFCFQCNCESMKMPSRMFYFVVSSLVFTSIFIFHSFKACWWKRWFPGRKMSTNSTTQSFGNIQEIKTKKLKIIRQKCRNNIRKVNKIARKNYFTSC